MRRSRTTAGTASEARVGSNPRSARLPNLPVGGDSVMQKMRNDAASAAGAVAASVMSALHRNAEPADGSGSDDEEESTRESRNTTQRDDVAQPAPRKKPTVVHPALGDLIIMPSTPRAHFLESQVPLPARLYDCLTSFNPGFFLLSAATHANPHTYAFASVCSILLHRRFQMSWESHRSPNCT